MGCSASRIDREGKVRICRERKKLMKQLLGYRREFADALLLYIRALRNTGATLRQFTESESLELEETTSDFAFPPSPPVPLPPPPPLPPSPPAQSSFSHDLRKPNNIHRKVHFAMEEDIMEVDEDSSHTPPPPRAGSSWDYWDPFGSSSPQCDKQSETMEQEEENWAETNSEFIDEDEEAAVTITPVDPPPMKQPQVEMAGDSSLMMSWHAKDTADMGMVVLRNKNTLSGIVKDLDEYFLKASATVKNIAVIIDINMGETFRFNGINENNRKRSNSAKVFRALTWSWSLKSLQSSRDSELLSESNEPCRPGAHCITLQKLYSEEQKLHKYVKEEMIARVEYGRKSLLLQRLEEDHDWAKAEKTRLTVESLESYILSMQESINGSCSTISRLINKELHPQIIALASGLMHMWHTMLKCHQVQSHLSQQLTHLTVQQHIKPTSEYHLQATAQLLTEVTSWYNSFCKLVKFQREYIGTLKRWMERTSSLANIGTPQSDNSLKSDALLVEWLYNINSSHDKMVSEAIKSLSSAVETIVLQQQEEYNMRKRYEKLGRKLERDLNSLSEVELKFEGSFSHEDSNPVTSKHPLLIRRAKVEALKTLVEDEKAKYANCVKATQALILNKLQKNLPNLFWALVDYSKDYIHSFEASLGGDVTLEQER